MHVLITDGGFLKNGTFRHMLYWDTDKLEELFRAEVFRLLLENECIGRDTVDKHSSEGHRQRRLSWAKMIQKVYEVNPLLCSFCGGEVKILSFIIKSKTIKTILAAMDLPSQKPEPLAHSPPLFKDTTYVPL